MEKKYGTTKIIDQIISFWPLLLMVGLYSLVFFNVYTGKVEEIIIFLLVTAVFSIPIFRQLGYSYTGLIIRDKELKFIGALYKGKVVAVDDIYEVAISAHSKKSGVVKFFYQEGDKYSSQKFNVSGMEDLEELVEEIRDFVARNGIDRTEILKKDLAGDEARIVEEIDFEKAGVKYNRSRDFFDNKPGFLELGFVGLMLIVVIVKLFPILPLSLGIKVIILLGLVGLIGLFYKWGYNLVHSALFAMLSPIIISVLLGLLFWLGEKLMGFFPAL